MEFKPSDKFAGVRILSSERIDGPMNYNLDEGANLLAFVRRSGIQKEIAYGEQVHQSVIAVCTKPGRYAGADGVCTRSDLALSVKSADCVPLMFFEKETGTIGAVHISRHNIITGIINSLAERVKSEGGDSGSTVFFLGPHIRREHYKLSERAVQEISLTPFGSFIDSEGTFDLTRAVTSSLEKNGFLEENIEDCGIDTFSNSSFYSSRADRQLGSGVSVFATVISKIDGK